MKKNIKFYIIFILCFFWILLQIVNPVQELSSKSLRNGETVVFNQLSDGMVLKQDFISGFDNIENIRIFASTYSRDNVNCIVNFKIYDNNVLKETIKAEASSFKDNSFFNITTSKLKEVKDHKITLEIIPNSCVADQDSISFHVSKGFKENSTLYQNDVKNDDDLFIEYNGMAGNYIYIWYPLIIISISMLFYILNNYKGEKHEK